MSTPILAVVLFAAFLHAGWNALIKSGPDKMRDSILVSAFAALISAAILPFLPLPDAASWPYILASATIHVAYYSLVGAAYRQGDMSYAYPLMRGLPPFLVALASGPLIGDALPFGAWAGILCLCGGVLSLVSLRRAPPVAALLNALAIAGYTLIDGIGVRKSGAPLSYTLWIFLLGALPLVAWASRSEGFWTYARSRVKQGAAGGLGTLSAYALVLWAMTQAPVAEVAALRETAILFGAAISALVLKEKVGWSRALAAAMVTLGAVLLRLA
jgi:drug/metabolite transporter (DMT)-like permease